MTGSASCACVPSPASADEIAERPGNGARTCPAQTSGVDCREKVVSICNQSEERGGAKGKVGAPLSEYWSASRTSVAPLANALVSEVVKRQIALPTHSSLLSLLSLSQSPGRGSRAPAVPVIQLPCPAPPLLLVRVATRRDEAGVVRSLNFCARHAAPHHTDRKGPATAGTVLLQVSCRLRP